MSLAPVAHHMSFSVRNLERSQHFYREVLGLEEIARPEMGLRGAWYRAGACEVHLIELPEGADVGAPPPHLNPMARHAAFAIGDYDEMLALVRSQGLEVVESRAAGQMWLQDPDGHVIELIVPGRIRTRA